MQHRYLANGREVFRYNAIDIILIFSFEIGAKSPGTRLEER